MTDLDPETIDLIIRRIEAKILPRAVDHLHAQDLAEELITAAEGLFYLADKTHASDACEALRLLLPKLLQREST
jgi:hypothetical protein